MTISSVAAPRIPLPASLPLAAVLSAGPDGSLAIRPSPGMAWRSALHRVFGIGKTRADTAVNRASWQALLDAIERLGGATVRQRLCRMEIRLAGDAAAGLSLADRLQRGSYIGPRALTQVAEAFCIACGLERDCEQARAALLSRGQEGTAPCPLEALFSRIANEPPVAAAGELPDTRRYVANQLMLALRPPSAWPAGPALDEARAALVREGLDPVQLESPALRKQLLQKLEVRALNGAMPGPGLHPAGQRAVRQLASVGLALSAWRRAELLTALMRNQQEIDALMAAELTLPDSPLLHARPGNGPGTMLHDLEAQCELVARAEESPQLAHLLSIRAPLLDELHRRLRFEGLWHGEVEMLRLEAGPQLEAIRRRRSELQTCLRSGAVPAERVRDAVRLEQLLKLCRMLRTLASERLMQGARIDAPLLLEMADELLRERRYLGQFLAARNLEYLAQIARGPGRQYEIAMAVRACADAVPSNQRGDVCNDDLFWLADQLGRRDHTVSALGALALRSGARGRFFGDAARQWTVDEVCDRVAEAIDRIVETRERWRALRADKTAALEDRWQACKEGLRDIVRTRELRPADLAPLVFEATRPYLEARHMSMRELNDERREADRRMTRYRKLFPSLASWHGGTEEGPVAGNLFDIAGARITAPLLRIADLCMDRQGEPAALGPQGWSMAALLALPEDDREQARRRERLRNGILDQLNGVGTRDGLLGLACSTIGTFTELWPSWSARRDDIGEVVFSSHRERGEAQALIEQARDLAGALGRLKDDVTGRIPLASVVGTDLREIQGNQRIACDGIDALAAALKRIEAVLRISPHLQHERATRHGAAAGPRWAAPPEGWCPPRIGDGRPPLPERVANWVNESIEVLRRRFREWGRTRRATIWNAGPSTYR
ncbi:hypothetical protein [Cupriavidus sp. AU9028]|uniref:hypothetical protein n=1 Tax=Cupriavidus sp. AU9028 TaxID=2871157 RepID=UPI001C966D51|nr:hypothetical protein [Cupriavidus sp. AU9028]MBY4898223.1 hypothetical protein [Cupriavidus sp. AU9028]